MQACKQRRLPSGQHFLIKEAQETTPKAFPNVFPKLQNSFGRLIYNLSALSVKNSDSAVLNLTGRLFIQSPLMFSKSRLLAAFQISNICETFHLARILALFPLFFEDMSSIFIFRSPFVLESAEHATSALVFPFPHSHTEISSARSFIIISDDGGH